LKVQLSSHFHPNRIFSQQSPIDLRNPVYAPELSDQVDISWSESDKVPCTPIGDGSGAYMPGEQSPLLIDGKKFEPKSLHFHANSEHLVNGSPYPVELHIVHQNDQDGTRAVVGVFVDDQGVSGSKADRSMNGLLQALDNAGADISPSDILPDSTDKFFRYEGSLTTAPYDENVSWLVLKEPIHVAPETLAELTEKHGHEAREVQDLNRRFVLANFSNKN
jgi:carbonic anhydrase